MSTKHQSPQIQIDELEKYGCERIFAEHASAATLDRPEFTRMMDQLRAGDEVVVWKLDRISRSLMDLRNLCERFEKMGVRFTAITQGVYFEKETPMGKLMLTILGAFAEFERDLIAERTKEGLEKAKASGKKLGRKPKLSKDQKRMALKLLKAGESVSEVARIMDCSRRTIERIRKKSKQIMEGEE